MKVISGAGLLLLGTGLMACSRSRPADAGSCAAGSPPVRADSRELLYQAATRIAAGEPDTLWVEVSVANWGQAAAELQWGSAALRVQAWSAPERTGSPAWDSQRETEPETGHAVSHPGYARVDSLPPGEANVHREWRRRIPVPELLGDSLPPGAYHLSATLRLLGDSVHLPAGCIRLE